MRWPSWRYIAKAIFGIQAIFRLESTLSIIREENVVCYILYRIFQFSTRCNFRESYRYYRDHFVTLLAI